MISIPSFLKSVSKLAFFVVFNKKELTDFLDSLNTKQFGDIQKFFETMPKLSYEVEYQNPNTKKKHKKTLEGLNSFFV